LATVKRMDYRVGVVVVVVVAYREVPPKSYKHANGDKL